MIPLELDVTDPGQIERAVERVGELGARCGLDALVNNAGIAVGGPLELLSMEEVRSQFEVNVFGQVAVTRALIPALRRARGRIVLISSVGGLVATPYTAPYAASKYALEAVGNALRVELAGSGIQVALIEPGSVATPIWEKNRERGRRLQHPRGAEGRVRSRSRGDGEGARATPPAGASRPSGWRRRSSGR